MAKTLRTNNITIKGFSKICRSESTLNTRSRHSYIYIIAHYNTSVGIIDIVSYTTYAVKSTANDRFFKKLFMAVLITLRVFDRNLMRENRRKSYFLYFV